MIINFLHKENSFQKYSNISKVSKSNSIDILGEKEETLSFISEFCIVWNLCSYYNVDGECKSSYDTDSSNGKNERKDVLHKEVEHEIDISQPQTFYQKFLLMQKNVDILPYCFLLSLNKVFQVFITSILLISDFVHTNNQSFMFLLLPL